MSSSIIFIGHVDAGKSTTAGKLVGLCGAIDERELSSNPAWVFDQSEEEREKGKTHQVGTEKFTSPSGKKYTILDAPGHSAFVPEIIGGAAQADIAVLVISSRRGEFEAGFERSGQTREHTILARATGVSRLIVAVNKMDDSNWNEERFNTIKSSLNPFLRGCGWVDVIFVPIVGRTGMNLITPVADVSWWTDSPTFIQALDSIALPERDVNADLFISVMSSTKGIITGHIKSGCLKGGDTVLLHPSMKRVTFAKIEDASAGDIVHAQLVGETDAHILPGDIITSLVTPAVSVTHFVGTVNILDVKNVFTAGSVCIMHSGAMEVSVEIVKIVAILDRASSTVIKGADVRFVRRGMKALITFKCERPCVLFTTFRFILRDASQTISVGVVSRILQV